MEIGDAHQHFQQPGLRQSAVVHARREGQSALHVGAGRQEAGSGERRRNRQRYLSLRHRYQAAQSGDQYPGVRVLAERDARWTSHFCHHGSRPMATQRLWRFAIGGKTAAAGTGARPARRKARRLSRLGGRAAARAVRAPGQTRSAADATGSGTRDGRGAVAATGIGRSIQRIPGGGISFVSRPPAEGQPDVMLTISELDPATRQDAPLVARRPVRPTPTLRGRRMALLLVSVKGQLFGWRRGDRPRWHRSRTWRRSACRAVTRLAISPKGDRIALVAAEAMRLARLRRSRYTPCRVDSGTEVQYGFEREIRLRHLRRPRGSSTAAPRRRTASCTSPVPSRPMRKPMKSGTRSRRFPTGAPTLSPTSRSSGRGRRRPRAPKLTR